MTDGPSGRRSLVLTMLTFDEAYAEAKGHGPLSILLGNGFSIACNNRFNYRRLVDEARFGGPLRHRRIKRVFDALGVADFEEVVRQLNTTADILPAYGPFSTTLGRLRLDTSTIRRSLAAVLAKVHPSRIGDVGDARLDACHDFLGKFDEVFTLNYDLLLYWASLRKGGGFDDGFRRRSGVLEHVEPDPQTLTWLHGALHFREEVSIGGEPRTIKSEWTDGSPLIDGLREDLDAGRFPLFVMEGTAPQKQRRIDRSPYLTHALAKLRKRDGSLCTFGWGLSPNDDHIMQAIRRSGLKRLYLGLHGAPNTGTNPETIGAANRLRAQSGDRITIRRWNTASAQAWGP